MTTIVGIPAHALLVHAIVVFAPLTALLEMLCALWPSARRRLVWLVLALAVGVTVLTPLTTSAGEWLYGREAQHSAILELHEQRGGWMIYFSWGFWWSQSSRPFSIGWNLVHRTNRGRCSRWWPQCWRWLSG